MDRVERETYRLHLRAAIFEGVFATLMWSSSEVARKGFDAGVTAIVLITMAPGAAQLLSLFIAGRIAGPRGVSGSWR